MQIGLPAAAYKMNGTMGWDKRLSAMLSARYVAAVVLKDRACWLEQFDAAHLADRAISGFAGSRVEVSIDPATEPDGASVRITCSNGQELTENRLYPKGDPRDPLTYEDVVTKLHAFGETHLGTSQLNQALPLLERLDTSDTIAPLLRKLSKNGK
jgi:2-methylcitrate dehydratase PrpD